LGRFRLKSSSSVKVVFFGYAKRVLDSQITWKNLAARTYKSNGSQGLGVGHTRGCAGFFARNQTDDLGQ
jgi:hypothetical protein